MGCGLFVAFYLVHMRIWAVAVKNSEGKLVLWIGGAANKNKDRFEQKFKELIDEISTEIAKTTPVSRLSAQEREAETPQLKLVGVK